MKIKISLAKILALVAPVVATLAATAATWLVVHVHFLALFHVTSNTIASAIAQAVVWGITALGTYLIQHKLIGGVIELSKLDRQAQLSRQLPGPNGEPPEALKL